MITQNDRPEIQKRLSIIRFSLAEYAGLGIIFGSQLTYPSIDRDIDLLLVTDHSDTKKLFLKVAELQKLFLQVVHIIPISSNVLKTNDVFQSIAANGQILWGDPSTIGLTTLFQRTAKNCAR